MKNPKSKSPSIQKKTPFLYRSFLNFWLAVVFPTCILALLISKLYYNNTINSEPLKDINTWFYFLFIQVFVSFFSYIWVYRIKSKSFDI